MTLHPDLERLALLGWRLTPATRTKKGMFAGYLDAATHDLDQLERWQHAYPGCCWKVVPQGSGIWALDVDVPGPDHADDGAAALRDLSAKHGPLPPRPHGRSGGGGHLLLFKDTGAPIKPGSGRPATGLDTCAGRVAFTVAPSIHRSGNPYRWRVAPWELAPPPAPDWLLKLVAPPPAPTRPPRPFVPTTDRAMRALMRCLDRLAASHDGKRNVALNREAYIVGAYVAHGAIGRAEAERALEAAGLHMGLSRVEVRDTVRSGLNAAARRPPQWGAA